MSRPKKTVATATTEQTGLFSKLILRTGDEIMHGRGMRTIESAQASPKKLIMDIEDKIRKIKDQQDLMLDNSPDNRYSLEVGKGFNSEEFVNKYHALNIEHLNLELELQVAKNNLPLLFG